MSFLKSPGVSPLLRWAHGSSRLGGSDDRALLGILSSVMHVCMSICMLFQKSVDFMYVSGLPECAPHACLISEEVRKEVLVRVSVAVKR